MWTSPDGIRHDAIPQRWRSNGRVIELSASPALAKRLGWVEDSTPVPFTVSKLKLRRALREIGLEKAFDSALASNPRALADWNDAQNLLSTDPMLVEMLPVLSGMAGLTPEQASELLQTCAGL